MNMNHQPLYQTRLKIKAQSFQEAPDGWILHGTKIWKDIGNRA